jgi:hypothetical protein
MKNRPHSKPISLRLGLLTLACLGLSTHAHADFLDAEVGARGIAMGGAFVAVNGDPASLFWNPAAVLSERRVQVAGMRTRFYDGIEDLSENFLGATFQLTDDLALAAGWTRTGLDELYYEDVVSFGAAWRVPKTRLQIGVSGLFYGADAPGYAELNDPNYLGKQWESSASIGLLYEISSNLNVGASFENLFTPEMALLASTTDIEEIGGRRRFGIAYLLQDIVRFTVEVRHHDFPLYYDSDWTMHGGAESWFNDVLALRVGVDDGDLTAGAGIVVRNVRFDTGMLTNERLGNTFRIAITVGY